MIAVVSGEVKARGSDWAIIMLGGFGLRVEMPSAVAAKCHVGENIELRTQLVVREDALTLYGFADEQQHQIFNALLAVNGVGPRSALGILSNLTVTQIISAIAAEDDKPFKTVSGIGPKTAKLIIVSLAGKLDGIQVANDEAAGSQEATPETANVAQVIDGLVGLGWSNTQAQETATAALSAGASSDPQTLLRACLKLLQGR